MIAACSGAPVDKIRLGPNDPRVMLRGVLPADTQLSVAARYFSSECSKRELIFPSGDLFDPTWHDRAGVSWVSKAVPASTKLSEYRVDLPADKAGKCQWYLDRIVMTFSLASGMDGGIQSRGQGAIFTLENLSSNSAADDPKFSPVIYSLDIDDWDDGKVKYEKRLAIDDGYAKEWYRSNEMEKGVNIPEARSAIITVSPLILTGYTVKIVSRFMPAALGVNKRYSEEISYPDGTVYFYSNSSGDVAPRNATSVSREKIFPLYPPSSQESKLATLMLSDKPTEIRELAHIYEIGFAVQKDAIRAAELYEKAARGGDVTAMKWVLKQAQYRQDKSEVSYWRDRLGKIK